MAGATLLVGAGALTTLSVWTGVESGSSVGSMAVAFVVGAAAAMVRVPSGEDRRWTLVPPVLLTVALIGSPAWPATVAVLGGAFLAQATSSLRGGPVAEESALGGACVMFLALAVVSAGGLPALSAAPALTGAELARALGAGASWFIVEGALRALSSEDWRQAPRYRFRRALADWPIAVIAVCSAVAFAVLAATSVLWAALIALAPYAVSHHLGVRLAGSRRVATLTVEALGRLPEAAGLSPIGHARAVASVARSIGRRLGYVGPELAELELAAQLHDIGLLASPEPEAGYSASDVAHWGAEILSSSHALAPAAAIVSAVREPYRIPGRDPDPELDVRAQIVQICCRLVECLEGGQDLHDAVEDLYDHSRYQLDPRVVALAREASQRSEVVLDEMAREP